MIKIIAYITMLIDHIARIYLPDNFVLSIIGRFSFPLFAWGISIGYTRTKNLKMYAMRLLTLAVVSQFPYSLLFKSSYINICITLLTGLLTIIIYCSINNKFFKYAGIIIMLFISQYLKFEYGAYGVLTILIFYLHKDNDYMIFIQGIITLLSVLIFRYDPIQLFSVFSIFIIMFLSKYDFKLNKTLQYSFYPAHLILLWLITLIMPGL